MIGTTRTGLPTHERLPDLLATNDVQPRKTRRIEFVGDRSPFDDERVQANLLMKRFTPTIEEAIRLAAKRAVVRIHKFTERVLERDHRYALAPEKHLGRTYRWYVGNNYIEDVDYGDVDAILGSPDGHQFIDLDAPDAEAKRIKTFSPEVFKLIAVDAVPSMSAKGVGPQHGDVVAAH
jgi:hypothetical protein